MSMKNMLEYLEYTAVRCPDKVALTEGGDGAALTFSELLDVSRRIGSALCCAGFTGRRIALLTERTPIAIAAMLGAAYAGACYVPLSATMPAARVQYILAQAEVAALICDGPNEASASCYGLPTLTVDDLRVEQIDNGELAAVRTAQSPEDELYIIFTSGSTGQPKGVVGCHRAVLDYAEALTAALGLDGDCVFGCQSPLYFDAPLKELLTMMKYGATVCLIPRRLFSFPVLLLRYLNDNAVNTICWVSSALSSVATLGALEAEPPLTLRTVVFGSEVFPTVHYRRWRRTLPQASFWQLYGPTEATGMSLYFRVDRDISDEERIPIGRPFDGTGLLLTDECGRAVSAVSGQRSETGEICLYGDCLTLGYVNDIERTAQAFVSMTLGDGRTVTVYRTGDLAYYNERGELVFAGRQDGQIKRMGHRIETGELEAVALTCAGVNVAACAVRFHQMDLALFYTGEADERAVMLTLAAHLAREQLPRLCRRLTALPYTDNGKIDRRALADMSWEEQ